MTSLIVGLGNPGKRYQETRHNAGYQALDAVIRELGVEPVASRFPVQAYVLRRGARVLFVKPTTFMNDAGSAVAPLVRYEKIPNERILVIYDDVDLPLGAIRYRPFGSAGGHRGMESVLNELGTNRIPRLRIGIGSNRDQDLPAEAYVLQKFTPEEQAVITSVLPDVTQTIREFLAGRLDMDE